MPKQATNQTAGNTASRTLSANLSGRSAVLGTFSDSGLPLAHIQSSSGLHRAGAPRLSEELVTGRELTKGACVKFSDGYVSEIKQAGGEHAHYSLIGVSGIVSAIGADKQACQVSYIIPSLVPKSGPHFPACACHISADTLTCSWLQVIFRVASSEKTEKMLIGRDGEFQLAYTKEFSTDWKGVQTACGATPSAPMLSADTVRHCPASGAPDCTSSHLRPCNDSPVTVRDEHPRGLGLMVAEQKARVLISSIAKGLLSIFPLDHAYMIATAFWTSTSDLTDV